MKFTFLKDEKVAIIHNIMELSDGTVKDLEHASRVYNRYDYLLSCANERNRINYLFNVDEEATKLYRTDEIERFESKKDALIYVYSRDALIFDRIANIQIDREGYIVHGGIINKNPEMLFSKSIKKMTVSLVNDPNYNSKISVFEDEENEEEDLPSISDDF